MNKKTYAQRKLEEQAQKDINERTEARLTRIYTDAVETAVASKIDTIDMAIPHWDIILRNKIYSLRYRIGDDLVRVVPQKRQPGVAEIYILKNEYKIRVRY